MSVKEEDLGNIVGLVVEHGNGAARGRLCRIVRRNEEQFYVEFSDGGEGARNVGALKLFYRYCWCNGEMFREDKKFEKCEHFRRGIPSARDAYCKLNGVSVENFCREYATLFFK